MNKAVRFISNSSTPGRGKAEYGGLSLQSARLGYSTVISLCLLRKPRKPHITSHFARTLRYGTENTTHQVSKSVSIHESMAWMGLKEINAVLLLFPQPVFSFSSVPFMYFYYRGHPLLRWQGDVGLPSTRGECHVKQKPHQVFIPQPVEQKICMGTA